MCEWILKGLISFLICCFLCLNASAQEPALNLESPFPVTETWGRNRDAEILKIHALIARGDSIREVDTDNSRALLQEAYDRSGRVHYSDGVIMSLASFGRWAITKGKYAQTVTFLKKAEELILKYPMMKEDSVLSAVYNNLAVAYSYMGSDHIALYYHYQAIRKLLQTEITPAKQMHMTLAYLNVGITLYRNGYYDQAMYYFRLAEMVSKASAHYEYLGDVYANQARIMKQSGNWAQHDRYMEKALLWCDSAERIYGYNNHRQRVSTLVSIGNSHNDRGEPDTGKSYFYRALAHKVSANRYDDEVLIYKGLGTAHFMLGNHDSAGHYLHAALNTAEELGIRSPVTSSLYAILSDYYTRKGNLEQSHSYLKQYTLLNDSLQSVSRTRMINQLEVRYRTSQKDQNIARQELLLARKENEIKDKNTWIIVISSASLLLVMLVLVIFRAGKHRHQIRTMKAIVAGEEQERSRIGRDLHDGIMVQLSAVKMNLSTLINQYGSLPGIEDFNRTVKQLDHATNELRRTAHNLMPAPLLSGGLPEAVYFFCKNIQQSVPLHIHVEVCGDVPEFPKEIELSLYRIVQELVQNIIKHAEATEAIVQLSVQNGLLMIAVEDNGRGISADREGLEDTLYAGLKTVRMRAGMLQGQLDISGGPGRGTIIYLEFDMKRLQQVPS